MLRAAVAGQDPPITDQLSWDVKLLATLASLIAKRQQKRSGQRRITTPAHEELIAYACYRAGKV
jgi:hypothetical protein